MNNDTKMSNTVKTIWLTGIAGVILLFIFTNDGIGTIAILTLAWLTKEIEDMEERARHAPPRRDA